MISYCEKTLVNKQLRRLIGVDGIRGTMPPVQIKIIAVYEEDLT